MLFVIFGLLLFSFEIYTDDKKQTHLIDQLQVLERQISREIETSRAKGVTKGTYAGIYSNSEKVFEISEEIQSDSLFPIASISKTFTAFSILKLIEGGYLKFHDPVSKYIAEFREISSQEDPILIQDLLQHTSGLPSTNGTSAITLTIGAREFSIPKPIYKSGKKFIYSNHNYRILAKLIENISTQTPSEYLNEVLFYPLQIKNIKMDHYDGAAGIITSADVLFQFANLILRAGKVKDTQFVMKKTIRNFFRKPKLPINKIYYGIGWFIEVDKNNILKIWHTGQGEYSYSHVKIYPKEKIISILFNLQTKKNSEKFLKMNSSLEKSIEEYVRTTSKLQQMTRNTIEVKKNPR